MIVMLYKLLQIAQNVIILNPSILKSIKILILMNNDNLIFEIISNAFLFLAKVSVFGAFGPFLPKASIGRHH